MVNDCFLGERNEEIEVFAQALIINKVGVMYKNSNAAKHG